MSKEHDEAYARVLLQMAEHDAKRVELGLGGGTRRAVALWMADELTREAAHLDIPRTTASKMRQTASGIRRRVAPNGEPVHAHAGAENRASAVA
jgi:hypothetical protein